MNPKARTILPAAHRPLLRLAACALLLLSAAFAETQTPPSPVPADDLRAFLARELATGSRRIVIPPGRYPLSPHEGSHLTFSSLKDIEIIAEDVELVCTATLRAVLIQDCVNVTLRGLTVDYDPLPFTQGEIVAMAPDKSWIDFQILAGYPESDLRGPFQIYDPSTTRLRRGDGRWAEEITPLGGRRHRVAKAKGYRFDPREDLEQIGDILVCKSFHGRAGSPHAFELRRCSGVRLEDITLHTSPSFGFLERGCHATTYLRCVIDRRPPGEDPAPRASARLRSLNADAFHSKDATKGPAILSCKARFQGDDAVNINGRFHYIRSSQGRSIRVAVIDRNATLREGDPVAFLPYSGPRPPDAVIVRRQPDPEPFSHADLAFLRTLRMDETMRASLLEGRATHLILTLDRVAPLAPGSLVCCPLRLGAGFRVQDCDFGETRSRGILIKASRGEVRRNRIHGARMHAILVSPEFWWMEAGMPSDLVIRDNHIRGSLLPPVLIQARGGSRAILPAGTLRDISILSNRFEDCAWPLIHVTSTSGLTIRGNIFPDRDPAHAPPDARAILLEQCETIPAPPP